jgi:hypothetical protein
MAKVFWWTIPLMAIAAAFGGSITGAATKPLQCTAIGMGDVILIRARYEAALSGHKTLAVFFEAKPGRSFRVGQRMTVTVAGVEVETAKLKTIVGGDVAIETQFDNAGVFGDHTKPFPPEFPQVAQQTRVAIATGGKTILGCGFE